LHWHFVCTTHRDPKIVGTDEAAKVSVVGTQVDRVVKANGGDIVIFIECYMTG